MTHHGILTRATFEQTLTPAHVRITQVMQLAIMAGPLFFSGVLFLLLTQRIGMDGVRAENEFLWLLTLVHLAFIAVAFLAGHMLSARIFSPQRLSDGSNPDDATTLALKCIGMQRTAIIVRLALLEAAAFLGLAICLMAIMNGALPGETKYWVNLASTAVLVLYCILTLPTKERLADWFERSFSTTP
jgi:hypothetical protein